MEYVCNTVRIKRQAVYTTNLNAPTVPITTTVPATATRTHRSITDYYGNKIYRDGELYMVLNPEGYMTKEGDTWEYRYYMYDHLGNIRVVHDRKGTILETNDYYPFGMPHAKVKDKSVQPYKFAGKELESMHGINLSDFEARWRGTAIPDFITPDPHQERYVGWSPYNFCANNPMRVTDPTGMDWFVNNENGNLIFIRGVSELTDELGEEYGIGEVSRYENLVSDDMFGEEVSSGRFDNILEQVFVYFNGPAFSEAFMNKQGYEMAERKQVVEEKFVDNFGGGEKPTGRVKSRTSHRMEVKKTDITYVKPGELNRKTKIDREDKSDNRFFTFQKEQVSYFITIPKGQHPKATSYYEDVRTNYKVKNTIIGWLKKLFN